MNKLFSNQRLGNSGKSKDERSDYQRDFDRIIFSTAFRRLQNKTQVFPLPGSTLVHNRLTHSLEVASVGRSLGSLVGNYLVENKAKNLNEKSIDFYRNSLYNVIASACLCHDLGNPAFGHSGEDAIASFFERNASELEQKFTPKQWKDFLHFEGNANAFRLLTQQQNGKSEGGLSLTFSTLSAIAKYPCESIAKDKDVLHRKKFGFFQSEKDVFMQVASRNQLKEESSNPLIYKRHPFVWLVEAADDICYNIIDLEDSQRLGIISFNDCKNLLINLIEATNAKEAKKTKQRLTTITDYNEQIAYLRAKAIGGLTACSANWYNENFDLMMNNKIDVSILDGLCNAHGNELTIALREIESYSVQYIYNHHSVVEVENAGYNVMYELLLHFIVPILKSESKLKSYDKKALKLIPQQFIYKNKPDYIKVMGILDFVSGMTDNYATQLYRRIKGIEIGMRF